MEFGATTVPLVVGVTSHRDTAFGAGQLILLCALGFTSYCVSPDVTHDPTIVNN